MVLVILLLWQNGLLIQIKTLHILPKNNLILLSSREPIIEYEFVKPTYSIYIFNTQFV